MDIILLRWCVDNANDHDHLQLQQLQKRGMTSPSNDVIEKNILPESTSKRQRGGDEDSAQSGPSVGIAIYAGEGINLIFPLLAAMKEPDKFLGCPSLLCCGMITAATVGITLGAAGGRRFEKVLKLLAALSLICTYPMQLDAAYHYIADELDIDNKKAARYGLRALLVIIGNELFDSNRNKNHYTTDELAKGTAPNRQDNHKVHDRLENYFIIDMLATDKKEATQYSLCTLGAVVTIAFAMIPSVYLIYFMGIIGSLCLSFLVLIVPGFIPFCTKNYGKIYWMAIVGALAIIIGILIFFGVADKRQQAADERLTESASESERVIEFNSALAYFLKVFMGCGIYAIPAAALISEIHLGISLIIGAYVIVALCLYIVMKTANGSKSYPEFIKKTFDNGYGYFPKASKIFEIFVIIIGFGFSLCICSVYLIFIVSHICKVVYVWHYMNPFENDANELVKFEFELDAVECRWWIPMAATVLVIFCFLPIWSKIALYIVALVGAIFQMAVIVLGFVYAIHYDVTDISVRQSWDLSNLFLVQSIAIYAGEGITTIFPLMAVMREPEKFLSSPSLLCSGMITVTAFAIIVVIVGAERLHILLNSKYAIKINHLNSNNICDKQSGKNT
uniref:Amino acid transporter transmembrane domain-containing protein n=1 Tax=Glossina palpalis gambiensis TaxID=67801 RepID=A0A1B0B1P0_9MUSC